MTTHDQLANTPTQDASPDVCCPSRALWGWSPPPLPADTNAKRRLDRSMPRTGRAAVLFFAAVIGLLLLAPQLPPRGELGLDALAALVAGAWCSANFWRCRQAHCLITSLGWLALSVFTLGEASLVGHSVIAGDEQLVFLAVLLLGLLFEALWAILHGTNAVRRRPG